MRPRKRLSCSSSLTDSQYLTRMIPERTSMRSNWGHVRMKSSYSSSEQNPMTCSTPARLYQLRSKSTISPADGRWAAYRWKYHCVRSRSVGARRATTRTTRGLSVAVMRLMTPPLPAVSRPSKMATTRRPLYLTHSSSSTSSAWSLRSCFSYSFLPSVMCVAGAHSPFCFFFALLPFRSFFLTFSATAITRSLTPRRSPGKGFFGSVGQVGCDPVGTGQLPGVERGRQPEAPHARRPRSGDTAHGVLDHQTPAGRQR